MRITKREIVDGFKAEINDAVDYLYKLRKANPDKDESSFRYTIRDTYESTYVGNRKFMDKRKFLKIIKLAAKETGAVVKKSGKKIRVIV